MPRYTVMLVFPVEIDATNKEDAIEEALFVFEEELRRDSTAVFDLCAADNDDVYEDNSADALATDLQ